MMNIYTDYVRGLKARIFHYSVPLLVLTFVACSQRRIPNYSHDVEISPGRWITLREERGKCWFQCEWNGKDIAWEGKRNSHDEEELPITLREHEGTLYLIVFNREKLDDVKFVFSKLDPSGTRFIEIQSSEFPRRIATQNMQLGERMVMVGNNSVDTWEVLRTLDIKNPYFKHSDTGELWIHLETGMALDKIENMEDLDLKQQLIREYAEKYKPIPLPTLVKKSKK